MFRFQHIDSLGFLILVPLLLICFVFWVSWRSKKLKQLGDNRTVLSQFLGFIPGRKTLSFTLLIFALTAIIIGYANLQKGSNADKVERKGIDVMIALDVSKSMLATDFQPNRLERSKLFISQLLDKMHNDRVGLILFAGRSYLQVPLTIDYAALRMMLQNANPDMVPAQGTVISDAIDLALKSFSQNEKKYKSLILISDGEDHDEHAIDKVKEAVESGVVINTIGIGSAEGTTLIDPDTHAQKLDEKGDPVITKLNEKELQSIATAGNGTYALLNNTHVVADKLINTIEGMEQHNLGAVIFSDYKSYFPYFLFPAFLLLIFEMILFKSSRKKEIKNVS